MVLKRKGIQLDRCMFFLLRFEVLVNSTVNHKSKICLYDSSVGHNQFNNVILCENNERKVFDNQKDMNRSWNRYKYQHRNILEDVQLKETKYVDGELFDGLEINLLWMKRISFVFLWCCWNCLFSISLFGFWWTVVCNRNTRKKERKRGRQRWGSNSCTHRVLV